MSLPATLLAAFDSQVLYSRSTPAGKLLAHPFAFLRSRLRERKTSESGIAEKVLARTFWGSTMEVYYPEPASMAIDRYGVYEIELTAVFLDQVRPGMTVFDIGTHFGYYSLLASVLVGASGSVHCFEPTPSTAEVLGRNLSKATNARINNVALYSASGEMNFLDFGVGYSSFNTVSTPRMSDEAQSQMKPQTRTVKTTTIDEYVTSTGAKPDFMKIDAENAERDILDGGRRTIASCRPMFTLEVGDEGDEYHSAALLRHAMQMDYVPMEYDPVSRRCLKHQTSDTRRYVYDNILMVPREKVEFAGLGQLRQP